MDWQSTCRRHSYMVPEATINTEAFNKSVPVSSDDAFQAKGCLKFIMKRDFRVNNLKNLIR